MALIAGTEISSIAPTRRAFFRAVGVAAVAAGIARRRAGLVTARALVRGGALGRIVFCRACQEEDHDALAALQFLLDASRPLSVTEHGAGRATLRFPGFVASLERSPGPGGSGIVICGSRATLTVRREGWHLSGEEA
jgi:hypothetical protein